MHFRNTDQIGADLLRTIHRAMFEVILWKNAGQQMSALPTCPILSTFRKYESSTTEKLLLQENAHGGHAIYYSYSTGKICKLYTKITLEEITKRLYHTYRPIIDRIDHCTVPGQFSEGYSIAACIAMLLSNYPRVKFLIWTFQSASFFTNRCQTFSIWSVDKY